MAQALALVLAAALVVQRAEAETNTTYCWGDGQFGTLGTGRATAYSWPLPAPVNSTASFAAVSAGWLHACALTDVGKAYCWVRWVGWMVWVSMRAYGRSRHCMAGCFV